MKRTNALRKAIIVCLTVMIVTSLCSCASLNSLFGKKVKQYSEEQIAIKEAKEEIGYQKFKNDLILIDPPGLYMDSVGGVDLVIDYKNLSDKSIKYATFYVSFYNIFGDEAICDIKHTNKASLKDTGPIKSGAIARPRWGTVIYNTQAKYCIVDKVEIDYIDGTSETIVINQR